MKITKSQLKQIIKEELTAVLNEGLQLTSHPEVEAAAEARDYETLADLMVDGEKEQSSQALGALLDFARVDPDAQAILDAADEEIRIRRIQKHQEREFQSQRDASRNRNRALRYK